MKTMMLGPGMYTQQMVQCPTCKGEGEIIPPGGRCKTCNGDKVIKTKKQVEVAIEKGTPDEHLVTLNGEGNELPGADAGDLIIKVNIKKHKYFKRVGADLWMDKTITLKQALLGFTFTVRTLDGSDLTISSTKGEVISHGQIMTVREKGMPFF